MTSMHFDPFFFPSSDPLNNIISESDAVEKLGVTFASSRPPSSTLFVLSGVLYPIYDSNESNVSSPYPDVVADPTSCFVYTPEAQDPGRTPQIYPAFFPSAHLPFTEGYVNPGVFSSTEPQHFPETGGDAMGYEHAGVGPPPTTLVQQGEPQHEVTEPHDRVTRKRARPVGTSATRKAGKQRRQGVKRLYKCPIPDCDGELTSLTNLRGHKDAHYDKKDYTCEFARCGKSFTYNHGRVRHQNTCRFRTN